MTPTRTTATRAKDPWQAFRANARTALQDAENKLALLEAGANAKGVAADAVLAAIAYGDAITAQRLNQHNAQDHGTLPTLVARALGKDAVSGQITRLGRILREKSRAHYGGGTWTRDETEEYLEQVRRFATYAEQVLGERE
jgi:hypothetical protein